MSGNDNDGRAEELASAVRGALAEPNVAIHVRRQHGSCHVHLHLGATTRVHVGDGVPLPAAAEMARKAYVQLVSELRWRLRGYLAAVHTDVRKE